MIDWKECLLLTQTLKPILCWFWQCLKALLDVFRGYLTFTSKVKADAVIKICSSKVKEFIKYYLFERVIAYAGYFY